MAALGDLVAESNAVAFPWGGIDSGVGSPVAPRVTHLACRVHSCEEGAGLQRSRSHFGADGAGWADSPDTRPEGSDSRLCLLPPLPCSAGLVSGLPGR